MFWSIHVHGRFSARPRSLRTIGAMTQPLGDIRYLRQTLTCFFRDLRVDHDALTGYFVSHFCRKKSCEVSMGYLKKILRHVPYFSSHNFLDVGFMTLTRYLSCLPVEKMPLSRFPYVEIIVKVWEFFESGQPLWVKFTCNEKSAHKPNDHPTQDIKYPV